MADSTSFSTSFTDAMALKPLGDGVYAGELNKIWTIGPKLHGGAMLALCAAAAREAHGGEVQPVSVSANYLSAPNPGEMRLETFVRKRGRRVSVVDVELIADTARVREHPDELPFIVGDTKLAERSTAAAHEKDEIGAVNVVRFAAHQAGPGEDHRRVRLKRRGVDVDVFFARECRRDAKADAAGISGAEHCRMREAWASAGDDRAAALGNPSPDAVS